MSEWDNFLKVEAKPAAPAGEETYAELARAKKWPDDKGRWRIRDDGAEWPGPDGPDPQAVIRVMSDEAMKRFFWEGRPFGIADRYVSMAQAAQGFFWSQAAAWRYATREEAQAFANWIGAVRLVLHGPEPSYRVSPIAAPPAPADVARERWIPSGLEI